MQGYRETKKLNEIKNIPKKYCAETCTKKETHENRHLNASCKRVALKTSQKNPQKFWHNP